MRYTARSANTQPMRRIHQNLNEMKILIVASDKGNKFAPFIEEQIAALQQEGVQIIRYGVTGKGITGYLSELPALRRLIRAERPDIVHAHFGLSGLLANLQRLVPVVTTYHGSDINVPKILRFSRIAMRLSAFNIFVSKRNVMLAYPKSFPKGKDLYEPVLNPSINQPTPNPSNEPTPNPSKNQPILNPSLKGRTSNTTELSPFPSGEGRGEACSFASVWGAHTADSSQYELLKENAKANRKNPTEAESAMWDMLKGNNIGYHFRRQHIILDYIVDFICLEKGLVIELDGGYHKDPQQKEYDELRTTHLQRLGYTELRFTNEEFLCTPDTVIQKIKDTLEALPSITSLPFREGSGVGSLPSLQGRAGDRLSRRAEDRLSRRAGDKHSSSVGDRLTSLPFREESEVGLKYALLPCGVNIPKPWSELQDQKVEQLTLNQWVQSVLSEDVKNVLFAGAFDNAVKDPELAKAAVEIAQAQIEDNKIKEDINNQQHRQLESTTLRANQHPCAIHEIRLIELKGYTREQVNALMYNCDALLLTSKTEGSPQVIKEAMACGCPIVSVDVGDVAERVSGVKGCYVVPSREPKDIAEAILQAIAYEGRTNGRDRIIEMGLSNEQVAKQLLRIYEQLLV